MLKRPLILAACALFTTISPVNAQDVTADTVVSTVNGTDITIGHMIVLRDGLPDQYRNLPDDVLFDGVLEQLIQQSILADNFEGLNRAIELRLENEERNLKAGAAVDAVIEERVTEEALQALYEERFAGAEPQREYNASHILVDTQEEAAALIEDLGAGASFATLAAEKSTGPSGPNGGQLGWFGIGAMVPPFEAAVVALEVGQVSEPVETQFGWHVIILNEQRIQSAPALDEVRTELMGELRQMSVQAVIDEMSADAEIVTVDTSTIDPSILRDVDLVRE